MEGAPIFHELVAPLAEAIDGAAAASFSGYFDIEFRPSELVLAKHAMELPHLCSRWRRPVWGWGDARRWIGRMPSPWCRLSRRTKPHRTPPPGQRSGLSTCVPPQNVECAPSVISRR